MAMADGEATDNKKDNEDQETSEEHQKSDVNHLEAELSKLSLRSEGIHSIVYTYSTDIINKTWLC